MEIRNSDVKEALTRLTVTYTELMDQLDVLSETGLLQKIDGLTSVGNWGMGMPIKDEYGISTVRGRLFHAQGDNIEGSLYVAWDRIKVLRVRWAGHVALYLNNLGNYVSVNWKDGHYVLQPLRLNGDPILSIEENRVRVEDLAHVEYGHQVRMLRWEYEDRVRQARALPSRVGRMIRTLFGMEASEPSLVLPPPPSPAYRSVDDLITKIETVRDGIERAIDILAPYVPLPIRT